MDQASESIDFKPKSFLMTTSVSFIQDRGFYAKFKLCFSRRFFYISNDFDWK